jgi:hypothetical protein
MRPWASYLPRYLGRLEILILFGADRFNGLNPRYTVRVLPFNGRMQGQRFCVDAIKTALLQSFMVTPARGFDPKADPSVPTRT